MVPPANLTIRLGTGKEVRNVMIEDGKTKEISGVIPEMTVEVGSDGEIARARCPLFVET